MTLIDRLLQGWRIAKTRPVLSPGMRVLDIGSEDGILFQKVRGLDPTSTGIDPRVSEPVEHANFRLVRGFFPNDLPADSSGFDAITMLAVLEHFPESAYTNLGEACWSFLKPNGVVLITVPAVAVDRILVILKTLRLVAAATLDEHHGYEVNRTAQIFAAPAFELVCHQTFQLGLNNFFAFRKCPCPE